MIRLLESCVSFIEKEFSVNFRFSMFFQVDTLDGNATADR